MSTFINESLGLALGICNYITIGSHHHHHVVQSILQTSYKKYIMTYGIRDWGYFVDPTIRLERGETQINEELQEKNEIN